MSRLEPETARTPLASHEHPPRQPTLLRMASSVHPSDIAKGERVEGDEHDPGPEKYEGYFKRAPKPAPHESEWKHRLHSILDDPRTHKIVLVFVILDLLVVLAEVFIDLFSFQDCRNHVGATKFEESHSAHVALSALRIVSLIILAGFLVENFLRLIVMGAAFYLKHWLHLFDISVVATSFFVTIFLHGALEEVVALFIFLRLWRVMRIVDGVAITLEEKAEKHKHKKNELIKQLKQHILDLEESQGGGKGEARQALAVNGAAKRSVQPLMTTAASDEQPHVTFTMQDGDEE